MIIIVCSLVAVLSVPLTGGDLRRMGTLPIARPWLAWGAILVQTVLVSAPWETPHLLGQIVHVGTYAMAAAFAIVNWRLPGVPVISVGGALNLAVILANGGVMPASASALRIVGRPVESGFSNSAYVANAKLPWLGDVFAIPANWPLSNVFSVGDIAVVIGVGYLAHKWCRRPALVDEAEPELTRTIGLDA